MNEMKNYIIGFGNSKEQKDFLSRHSDFFKRYENLKKALEIAFLRKIHGDKLEDTAIFYLGRLCVEDFMEIMLLCGNGCGIGAMKILRGMYERAVTAYYLHLCPEETENFFDYYWVAGHKLGNAIEKCFGESLIPRDKKEQVEIEFNRVREKYMVTDCKKCGTKKLNHTWSKLDFVTMAYLTGSLGKSIIDAYYVPTSQIHSTVHSILSRLEPAGEGITFQHDAQRKDADIAFITAHSILLQTLDLQKEHFNYDPLKVPFQKCFKDFMEIWRT